MTVEPDEGRLRQIGFQEGAMWAACYVATIHDQPGFGAEICKEAGISRKQLKACDEADKEACAKILAEGLYRRKS